MLIHKAYKPFQLYFRRKRMDEFQRMFALNDRMSIIDIGGTTFNWQFIPQRPRIEIVNLNIAERTQGNFHFRSGDARRLDYPDKAFDIAYSNSVIEHLETFENQKLMASEVRRVARAYYVQTPNRHFFMEPHYITPFIHYLPPERRARALRNFSVWGWITRPDRARCERSAREIRLITREEMTELFPDAEIVEEKFMGMTKSFIAVRRFASGSERRSAHDRGAPARRVAVVNSEAGAVVGEPANAASSSLCSVAAESAGAGVSNARF
jgi:Methyltransferase domain